MGADQDRPRRMDRIIDDTVLEVASEMGLNVVFGPFWGWSRLLWIPTCVRGWNRLQS